MYYKTELFSQITRTRKVKFNRKPINYLITNVKFQFNSQKLKSNLFNHLFK